MNVINLDQKFGQFSDHWHPRVVADLNDQHVKLAKVQGEFIWHSHEAEDELFVVVRGQLHIEFRDHTSTINPGEMLVVPRGVEHRPYASEETWIMLVEPQATRHTGTVEHALTRHDLLRI
ncbi:cupin domain-containing protein [Hymenobacter sp. UYCo722]|uniref:cupin domain-containing protein n=1 Tax=Hymenobacter sp. UYCo722 TaxID=3156335 RepID=UPI00339482CE